MVTNEFIDSSNKPILLLLFLYPLFFLSVLKFEKRTHKIYHLYIHNFPVVYNNEFYPGFSGRWPQHKGKKIVGNPFLIFLYAERFKVVSAVYNFPPHRRRL